MKKVMAFVLLVLLFVSILPGAAFAHTNYKVRGHADGVTKLGTSLRVRNSHGTIRYCRYRIYYHVTSSYYSGSWHTVSYHRYYYVLPNALASSDNTGCHWTKDGIYKSSVQEFYSYWTQVKNLVDLNRVSYQKWRKASGGDAVQVLSYANFNWNGAE